MSGSNDPKRSPKRLDRPNPSEPTETRTILFEWPLHNLKGYFDSSKSDTKSKVIKSVPFGGGRWTVLFYAQSGIDQFCSLYLNAEPLHGERIHPLLPGSSLSATNFDSNSFKPTKHETSEEKWVRAGLFRFTFQIYTLDRSAVLGTKEAHDHAFSHKTSNWGWAQFSKRDTVFYANTAVRNADAFLISVSITSSPEKPHVQRPIGHTVPPVLVDAMGSLLDDPDHSDIVFVLQSRRQTFLKRSSSVAAPARKIYAIKKILASRCEYFKDMFEGGFLEADVVDSSDDESVASPSSLSHDRSRSSFPRHSKSSVGVGQDSPDADDDDFYDSQHEVLLDDSDEEIDPIEVHVGAHPSSASAVLESGNRDANTIAADDGDDDEFMDEDQVVAVHANTESPFKYNTEAFDPLARSDQMVAKNSDSKNGGENVDESQIMKDSSRSDNQSQDTIPQGTRNSDRSGFHAIQTHGKGSDTEVSANVQSVSSVGQNVSYSQSASAMGTINQSCESTRSQVFTDCINNNTTSGAREKRCRNGAVRNATSDLAKPEFHKKRRKVVVRDAAYPTFKSLLYYLYTDTVEFAPLTSSFMSSDIALDEAKASSGFEAFDTSGQSMDEDHIRPRYSNSYQETFSEELRKAHARRQAVVEAYCSMNPSKPSPCSAKAMYRLADKLQVPDLKKRAQEHIANSLTVQNIVWEVFSGFNTQFPDIRKMETDFLLKHWPEVKRTKAMRTIFHNAHAHPGLAEVWPYLLSQLEYKGSADESAEADDSE